MPSSSTITENPKPKPRRKPKKPASTKLKTVPLSDGWTQVIRGPIAQSIALTPPSQLRSESNSSEPESTKELERLRGRYAKYAATWRASSSREKLSEQISTVLSRLEDDVVKAVCLCLGSPSSFGEAGQRATSQLVVFDSIVEMLKTHLKSRSESKSDSKSDKNDNVKVESFIQEPLLTPTDKTFLSSHGHVVLDVPTALEYIDSTSLVFIPCGEKSVISEMLKTAFPAIYIGNELDGWIDFAKDVDPILKTFHGQQSFVKFPKFEHANWTDVMVIG